MKHTRTLLHTGIALLTTTLLVSGCSTQKPAATSAVIVSDAAAQTSVEAALVAVADTLAQARNAKLDLYAPTNMKAAVDAVADAQKLRQRGKPDAEVMLQVNAANGFLKAADANKTLAETALADVIAQRQVLEELDAQKRLPRDFAKSTEQFRDLMATLESGNAARAQKEQQKVLAAFVELEVAVLLETHLAPAEAMLKKAEKFDADDFAPVSFAAAENTIKAARKIIQSAPKDRMNVKLTGESALAAASKAYFVGEESRQIVKLDEKKAEQRVLHYFSLLERINKSGAVKDLGSMTLDDQALALGLVLEQATAGKGRSQLEQQAPAMAVPLAAPAQAAIAAPLEAPAAAPEISVPAAELAPAAPVAPEALPATDSFAPAAPAPVTPVAAPALPTPASAPASPATSTAP